MNDIGYLKISNRVCVALSRAKHGMFIFGNSHCLLNFRRGVQQQNQLWQDVIAYLKNKDFIGSELTLKCRNHSNVTKVKEIKDFQNVPEGGCKKQCNVRLDCGHTCESFCHPYMIKENDETGHNDYKCFKPCVR